MQWPGMSADVPFMRSWAGHFDDTARVALGARRSERGGPELEQNLKVCRYLEAGRAIAPWRKHKGLP
jgi:hypothetical protein